MKTLYLPALLLLSLVSSVPKAGFGQAQALMLTLPRSFIGENAGSKPQSVCVGSGKLAFGSPQAKNPAGVATGGVHIYDEKSSKYLYSLYPPDGAAGDEFGSAVAISGGRIAIGAPGKDDNGVDSGAAYVFDLKTHAQIAKATASSFLAGERGGSSVALEAPSLYVGAPYGDVSGVHPQSGFVARVNASTGVLDNYFRHGSPATNDHLGAAIAVQGGLLVVGVPDDDVGALVDAGSVQLFSLPGTTPIAELLPSTHAANDHIGDSVALDRNTVVAGSGRASGGRGKIANWIITSLTSPLPHGTLTGAAAFSGLGSSVSLAQGIVVAGAPGDLSVVPPATSSVGMIRLYDLDLRATGTLQPNSLPLAAGFGSSVFITGTTVVASSPMARGLSTNDGTLWKFSPVLPSAAQVIGRLDLLTGDSAGVAGSVTFSGVREGAATGGYPSLVLSLSGSGSSSGRNVGLWSTFSGAGGDLLVPISTTGVPDSFGIRETSISSLMVNSFTGDSTWRSALAGTGVTSASNQAWVIHSYMAGITINMLRTGQVMSGGEVISGLSTGRINQASNAGFGVFLMSLKPNTGLPAVNSSSDSAVAVTVNGAVLGFNREGVSPSLIGNNVGQLPSLFSLTNEKTAFIMTAQPGGAISTANNVYVDDNGSTVAARKGDLAPDTAGIGLSAFTSFRAATRGTSLAFLATLATGGTTTSANNDGLWSNRVGATRLVLRKGDPAPVIGGGVKIARILKHGINTANNILMLVQLSGPGVNASNDQALYLSYLSAPEPGVMRLLLREGDVVPGTGGARLASILGLDLTSITAFSNSCYGVLASLVTQTGVVTPADNLVWLVGKANGSSSSFYAEARPVVILRKGARFQGLPSQDTVTSIAMIANSADSAGALNNGLPHTLAPNFGESTLKITFANKKQAVVLIPY